MLSFVVVVIIRHRTDLHGAFSWERQHPPADKQHDDDDDGVMVEIITYDILCIAMNLVVCICICLYLCAVFVLLPIFR